MDILNFGVHFLGNILTIGFSYICWLTFSKINKKTLSSFLIVLVVSFITTIISQYFPNPIKMINSCLIFILICYLSVIKDLRKSILSVISSQIILWLAECSFAVLLLLFKLQNLEFWFSNSLIYLLLIFYMVTFAFVLLKFKVPQKLYTVLINSTSSIKNNETIIYSFIIIAVIIIATAESYMNLPITLILITNIIMAIVFIIIIITSSKLKNNYNKINKKYETSVESLKEYEVMINQFSVYTHENRNEFYTIRNMLKDEEPRESVIKYIDTLVDNKIKDNEKIMKKTAKIPSGGLRATIYSKLCLMDKLKIKYKLNISRDVRTTDLIDLDQDLVLKICKILGVFLDNAIDAVKGLKKRNISVEMYIIDNYLCIDITNNFKGNLDLEKISNTKYTTKGDGHGYGLSLVSEILSETVGKLENEKSINRDNFTQTLKIKM